MTAAAARRWIVTFVICATAQGGQSPPQRPAATSFASVPLTFEPNVGQAPEEVEYFARGARHGVLLRQGSAALVFDHEARPRGQRGLAGAPLRHELRRTVLGLRLVDARASAGRAEEPVATRSNWIFGRDPARWRLGVPNFARVTYPGVLDGVDVTYHALGSELEYDFVVAPGASAGSIRLSLDGAQSLQLEPGGDLVVGMDGGSVRFRKPVAWQDAPGGRKPVAVQYAPPGDSRVVSFLVGAHDPALPLVIDPVVTYATYAGGANGEHANGVVVDASGAAWLCGSTSSADFPLQNPFQPANAGGIGDFLTGDAFVMKLSAAGDAVEFSTYLGGAAGGAFSGGDSALAIALDPAGGVVIAGATESLSFPTTPGAFQPAHGGQSGCSSRGSCSAAFVTKLDAAGVPIYSTYLGGLAGTPANGPRYDYGFYDRAAAVAVDAAGRAVVAGGTQSDAFPVTPGAPQAAAAGGCDGFLAILNSAGTALDFSTYIGGPLDDDAHAVALAPAGRIVVAGHAGPGLPTTPGSVQIAHGGAEDGFVVEIDPAAPGVAWCTYLGGRGPDQVLAAAVDGAGNVVVTGDAGSADFPVQPPGAVLQPAKVASWDAFVTRIAPDGATLVSSTWLGGRGDDHGRSVALDPAGRAIVAGETWSVNFPLQDAAPLTTACDPDFGCDANAFVSIVSVDASALCWSELFGGPDNDGATAVTSSAAGVHLAGWARAGLATTPGAFQETQDLTDSTSAFVMHFTGFSCP